MKRYSLPLLLSLAAIFALALAPTAEACTPGASRTLYGCCGANNVEKKVQRCYCSNWSCSPFGCTCTSSYWSTTSTTCDYSQCCAFPCGTALEDEEISWSEDLDALDALLTGQPGDCGVQAQAAPVDLAVGVG